MFAEIRTVIAATLALLAIAGLSPASAQQRYMMGQGGRLVPHYNQTQKPVTIASNRCIGGGCQPLQDYKKGVGKAPDCSSLSRHPSRFSYVGGSGKPAFAVHWAGNTFYVCDAKGMHRYTTVNQPDTPTGAKCFHGKSQKGGKREFVLRNGVVVGTRTL